MKRLISLLRNKYFLATVAFLTWMLFFDRNDFMTQYDYHTQLNTLKAEKQFYIDQTNQARKELDELTTNRASLERFARERYHMKKDNEDVYVIVSEKPKEEKSLF
ncbi:FtsB family cell division protein [Hufsiella ginkgonis]|uniref:Septum formation initiator family protein n=1 Tax=Hufsiella ginkgonis TaxID=2695274 RepID=A0A7K1Y205_9SPHI|nr:septum formation initiator family protein [Hufsiella ginkgonis]MXV17290.1 septum formation initiator family protein [Hufsiella ginkgonis]